MQKIILTVLCCLASSYGQTVFNGCGLEGDATTALEKQLNPLKNRSTSDVPTDATHFNPAITLEAMLQPSDTVTGKHPTDINRFSTDDMGTITGYVVKEKLGGTESCNCHATDSSKIDRHLYIGKTKDAALNECVIAEFTPRFYELHPEWMDVTKFQGHLVSITGFMFYDKQHEPNAENNHPGNKKNWRATCWEIHPIVDIKIIE